MGNAVSNIAGAVWTAAPKTVARKGKGRLQTQKKAPGPVLHGATAHRSPRNEVGRAAQQGSAGLAQAQAHLKMAPKDARAASSMSQASNNSAAPFTLPAGVAPPALGHARGTPPVAQRQPASQTTAGSKAHGAETTASKRKRSAFSDPKRTKHAGKRLVSPTSTVHTIDNETDSDDDVILVMKDGKEVVQPSSPENAPGNAPGKPDLHTLCCAYRQNNRNTPQPIAPLFRIGATIRDVEGNMNCCRVRSNRVVESNALKMFPGRRHGASPDQAGEYAGYPGYPGYLSGCVPAPLFLDPFARVPPRLASQAAVGTRDPCWPMCSFCNHPIAILNVMV